MIAHDRVVAVAGADPASFALLGGGHARDAANIYFEGARVPVRDPRTFELLEHGFARDRTTGYYLRGEVAGSEGATFAAIGHHYAKDAARVYFADIVVGDGDRRPYVRRCRSRTRRAARFAYWTRDTRRTPARPTIGTRCSPATSRRSRCSRTTMRRPRRTCTTAARSFRARNAATFTTLMRRRKSAMRATGTGRTRWAGLCRFADACVTLATPLPHPNPLPLVRERECSCVTTRDTQPRAFPQIAAPRGNALPLPLAGARAGFPRACSGPLKRPWPRERWRALKGGLGWRRRPALTPCA